MSYTIENMFKNHHWTENGHWIEYTFEFAFKTREEYLDQTVAWKAEYKELSKRIRQCKLERKQRNRPAGEEIWHVQMRLDKLKEQARLMLQMRKQAKQEAGRQSVKKLAA